MSKEKCSVLYTGIGANPGGCHNDEQFIAAMKHINTAYYTAPKRCRSAKDKQCVDEWIMWAGAYKAKTLPSYHELPNKIQEELGQLWPLEDLKNGTLVGCSDGTVALVATKFASPAKKSLLHKFVKRRVA